MDYIYLGIVGNYCSILHSEYPFEELEKKAAAGVLTRDDFTSCEGTNWNSIDNLSRTLALRKLKRTGRVARSMKKILFSGVEHDMWHTYPWTHGFDTFCEAVPAECVEEEKSRHLGAIGQGWILEVKSISPATRWGAYTLYVITDKRGNVFTCKSRHDLSLEKVPEGKQPCISAVVKRHAEYKGVKQTWIEHPHMFYV